MILPQNSAHRLRQSGEAPTHIVCGSLRLHTTSRYFLTALPEVLCLAPPPHSPASIWLNAAILLLQQESEHHLPGADVLYSQQCATLFTLAVRDWLSQAGTAKSVLNLLLHPRLGRVILHMLETPAHPLDGRNAGATGTHVAGEFRPAISRRVRYNALSRVNNAAPANRRPDPVA